MDRLRQAMELSMAHGFLRPFQQLGGELLALAAELSPDARRFVDDVRALGRARRLRVPEQEGRPREGLQEREIQILDLVADGMRNRDIGERLFLSEETVKWYLKHLYRKLGVRSRMQAVQQARAQGLLDTRKAGA